MGSPPAVLHIINGRRDGVRAQDHARAAAIGRIVDLTMAARSKVPRVGSFDGDEAAGDSLSQQAGLEKRSEDLGKQGDDLDHQPRRRRATGVVRVKPIVTHEGQPPPVSLKRSIATMYSGTAGSNRSAVLPVANHHDVVASVPENAAHNAEDGVPRGLRPGIRRRSST